MSFTYSDLNVVLTHEQEEKLDNVLIDLSLVCSRFFPRSIWEPMQR